MIMRNTTIYRKMFTYVILLCLFTLGLYRTSTGQVTIQDAIERLKNLNILDTVILSTNLVKQQGDIPEYCRVTGYVLPSIYFEVRLPTSKWNRKFYMAGCGGFCGRVMDRPGFTNSMTYGLKRNYAVATTDMGHWGESMMDGLWALNNRQKEIDYGYRATHEVARVAKEIIKGFYGQAPVRSYFAGCSNGGRQALMEAQRYPEDFDGIICGAPSLDLTGLIGIHGSWVTKANRGPDGKPVIGLDKLKLIVKAVYSECDGQDGLVDGIISDPRRARFDPKALLCKGTDTSNCLTPLQVSTLEKLYSGARDSSGKQLYPGGMAIGSEPFWDLWIIGGAPSPYGGIMPAFIWQFNSEFLRYLAFATDPDPNYDPYSFNFDSDPPKLKFMSRILDAVSPDLSRFRDRGGKIIMYQGWADPAVTPFRTIEYYESVVNHMGGLEKTQDFFRLFMVPGMAHCQIPPGRGPDNFDLLTPLELWVETGLAPDQIIATQLNKEGKVERSRPLYPYPKAAVYKGSGSINDASSFVPK